MKRFLGLVWLLGWAGSAFGAAVMAGADGWLLTPTNFFGANGIAGTNLVKAATNDLATANSNTFVLQQSGQAATLTLTNDGGTNLAAWVNGPLSILGSDGDANLSGAATSSDITLMRRDLQGVAWLPRAGYAHGDVDGDGIVTDTDILAVRQKILGLIAATNVGDFGKRFRAGMFRLGVDYVGSLTSSNFNLRVGVGGPWDNYGPAAKFDICGHTNTLPLLLINTNWFIVNSNGYVGIFTNNPQAALHVVGAIQGQYSADDGSAGLSVTNVFYSHDATGAVLVTNTLVFKNGLLTSWTTP